MLKDEERVIFIDKNIFTIAIDYRMISMENEAKQKQLKPQKILSVSLFVAITRMSSANRAYNVIIDIIIEK